MSWNKLSQLGFVCVLAAVGTGCSGPKETETKRQPAAVAVETSLVKPDELMVGQEFSGIVRSRFNVVLSAKVTARVISVSAREGDPVRAGQLLISLDPRETSASLQAARAGVDRARTGISTAQMNAEMERAADIARVQQARSRLDAAQAGLAAAQARNEMVLAGPRPEEREQTRQSRLAAASQLTLAQSENERAKTLFSMGAVSRKQAEQAEATYRIARAALQAAVQAESMSQQGSRAEEKRAAGQAVRQAEAAVREARGGVAEAQALTRQAEIQRSQVENARAQLSEANALAQGAATESSETRVVAPFNGVITTRTVDQGAMAYLGAPLVTISGGGMRLEVDVPEDQVGAFKLGEVANVRIDALGRDFRGRISEISAQGDVSTHTFVVRLDLPAAESLKAGMFGRVALSGQKVKGTWLPADSIITRDGMQLAFVVEGGVAKARILTLGPRSGSNVLISSGIQSGDHVIRKPQASIEDGLPVAEKEMPR